MEIDQLKNLEKSELVEKIGQLKQELFHFQKSVGHGSH